MRRADSQETDIKSARKRSAGRALTHVKSGNRSYLLEVDPMTTLNLAWASQKCWFMPGSIVIITDDNGESKTFVKE